MKLPVLACLSCAFLWSVPAAAQTLTRHPYLQRGTPTAMTVAWDTNVATQGRVAWGAAPGALDQVLTVTTPSTQHVFEMTGLTADTVYYYAVGTEAAVLAGDDATHFFRTSPVAGTRLKTRMWVVGDSGTGDAVQAAVRDAMLGAAGNHPPELFIHVGDMAYTTGTTAEFTNNFFAPYASIMSHTVTWPAIGNHEAISANSSTQTGPYYDAYVLPTSGQAGGLASGTEAYYSFDHGNVHFVVLDSAETSRATNGAMLTWMVADLAATQQDWIIAYWHHPPYTKGSHNSDTEVELIEMRENALPLLEAAGVDLVLAGHSHIYERSFLLDGAYATPTVAAGHIKDMGDGKPLGTGPYVKMPGQVAHNGTVYVVAGHGGTGVAGTGNHPVMYFSELRNGSCILDVDHNRLELVNVRSDGVKTDRFAMLKGPGLLLAAPEGGEQLMGGSTFQVRWVTVGAVPNVNLEYSPDNGASWFSVATNIANTGTYAWTVPSVSTTSALLRVSNTADAAMNDDSNAGFTISGSPPVTAIPLGDTWLYNDTGTDLGASWMSPSYDDSAWPMGAAQLGYGDGDEATLLSHPNPLQPSLYFRKHITVTRPVMRADLAGVFDDGLAVWINGTQVLTRNMANGTGYAAFASATSADNQAVTGAVPLTPNPFVVGENVLAVMVKQANATSSDVSFDLSLTLGLGDLPATDAGMASQDAAVTTDAAVPVVDASVPPDASAPGDASVSADAAAPGDASVVTTPDAAVAQADASVEPSADAGASDAPARKCGCQSGSPASSVGAWLAALLLLRTARRRR